MKYICCLIVLLCNLCNGQKNRSEYTKLIAYRLIEQDADGPCSIVTYMNHAEFTQGYVVSAASVNKGVIDSFCEFVRKTKKNKAKDFYCNRGCIGCDVIDYFIVLESTSGNDTIFLSDENQQLLTLKKDKSRGFKAYKYKSDYLYAHLNSYFYGFFTRDFEKEKIRAMSCIRDSVPLSQVLFEEQHLYSVSKNIILSTGQFKLTDIDTIKVEKNEKIFFDITTRYKNSKDEIKFENDVLKYLTSFEFNIVSIDSITIGSTEDSLKKRFPLSTSCPWYYSIIYEEIMHKHSYTIAIEQGQGTITFYITDGIICRIEVLLYK